MKTLLLVCALIVGSCAGKLTGPTGQPGCNPTSKFEDFTVDEQGNQKPTLFGNAKCYACEGASSCAPAGDEWCCADRMCTECEPSLIGLKGKPDGGTQ